jgi:PAS domain S-box-containing protein
MKSAVESTNAVYTDFFSEEKIRVLHVDNDAPFLEVAQHCLEEQGLFQVDTALSAKEALEKLRNTDYDVVVADYQMPGKNGLELLKELRQKGNDVPFILFTCAVKEEIAIEALNSGVEQYIDKQGSAEATYEELKYSILSAVKRRKMEKRLKDSENFLRQITENMQDMLVLADENLGITYVSSSVKGILGYEPSLTIGKCICQFIHPDDLTALMEALKEVFRERSGGKLELRCKRADGSYVLMEGATKVLTDKTNQVTGIVITARDITERNRMEAVLRKNEERFNQVSDNARTWMWEVDPNGLYTYSDPTVKKVLGYKPEEIIGKKHFYDFFLPEEREKLKEKAFQAFATKSPFRNFFNRNLHKNGSIVWLSTSGIPIVDEKGKLLGYKGADADVTENRRMAQAVEESEEKYRKLFEEAIDAIFAADYETGILIDCNNAAAKLVGREKSEIIGMHQRFLHPEEENGPEFGRVFEKHRSDREGQIVEDHIITKNGEVRDVAIKPSLIEVNGKKIVQGIFRDVTEHKKAVEALNKSEEKYRKMFEEATDAIFIADAETGILIDCNRAATELVGREKSEIIGMHQRSLHPEEKGHGKFSRTFTQHFTNKEGIMFEDQIVTKNGEVKDVSIKGNLFEVNGRKMLRGSFRDITESKKISEQAHFQARLLNAVGQAIIGTDIDGNIIYWNHAAEQLYGWPEAEVLGRNIVDVTPAATSKEQATKIHNKLISGESWSGEFVAQRRDGAPFSAIVTDAPITNDKGEVIGIIGVSTDISEQKWMQEIFNDAIGKVVELNEKLHVVGSLTRHDVRNKLAAVNGRIFLLKKKLGGNTEALLQLREMELAAQQMLRILEFERIYEQVGVEEMKPIDVERHLNEAVSLFSDLKGAELTNECHGLTVLADSLLRQVFYNLLDNSMKYGEKIRKIRVHYKSERDQLKLIYEDDGVGIPEDVKCDLFKEGFGKGTGYGLYLIKRICEAYGWTIQETGKHGQGAQFTMTIPRNNKNGEKNYEIN